jgi:hypothetical protein
VSNLLQQGSDWLQAQRAAFMSSPVTYTSMASVIQIPAVGTEIEWSATVGRTQFEQVDTATGAVLRTESRDYIGTAADLIVDGRVVEPLVGDFIVQTVGGVRATYEVMSFGAEPAFRYEDSDRLTVRVHTKRVNA